MRMNSDPIKGGWKQTSEKIKLTWGQMSEDNLTAVAGRHDKLASLLQ